jgi:hypothetical protein
MIKCKTYPLTRPEMEAAKKFLDKNQAMGYCQGSKGPCAQHMQEGLSRGDALVAKSISQVTGDKVTRPWGE